VAFNFRKLTGQATKETTEEITEETPKTTD